MCNKTVSVLFIPKLKPIFWNKMYYFFYVAHFKSYSKAARALNMTQPVLSRALQKLEQRLAIILLIRKKRQIIHLTPAGVKIMIHIEKILCELRAIEECARN